MNGLIFFEDGTVIPFGELQTVRRIAQTAQRVISELASQERAQLLATVSTDELKVIAQRLATENRDE